MIAAGKGYLETVKALVEAGADAKAKNSAGDTSAVIALRNGHTAVAQYLAPTTLLPALPPFKL
jgi:ankyrin repeat protein